MKKKNPPFNIQVSEEESALFRKSIGKVTRIHHDRVTHSQKRKHTPPLHPTRHCPVDTGAKSTDQSQPTTKELLRKLKRGQFPIDGQLDLHGKGYIQAESALNQFIEQASYLGCHCILIIHGKGVNSAENLAILKELTLYLLGQHPKISHYATAIEKHGGHGATYALLHDH